MKNQQLVHIYLRDTKPSSILEKYLQLVFPSLHLGERALPCYKVRKSLLSIKIPDLYHVHGHGVVHAGLQHPPQLALVSMHQNPIFPLKIQLGPDNNIETQ